MTLVTSTPISSLSRQPTATQGVEGTKLLVAPFVDDRDLVIAPQVVLDLAGAYDATKTGPQYHDMRNLSSKIAGPGTRIIFRFDHGIEAGVLRQFKCTPDLGPARVRNAGIRTAASR
jgi:hypothetical protein